MKKTQSENKRENFPATLLKSFWLVFTLPFRTMWFGFKKLFEIPLQNLAIMFFFFLVLVGATLVAFVQVTSQPAFCVTCHYMKPYFESWEHSSHHSVPCTECHFPPGVKGEVVGKFTAISMVVDYITGVYKKTKPWAEISDASCLRPGCHETRLLHGKVKFKEGIVFDHTPHLLNDRRGKRLRCTSCHSQIVQGTHMTVTEETCFLCHFKDQPETSPMTKCTFCHQAPVAKPGLHVIFDHTNIVQRNVDCKLCHGPMAVGNGDVPKERCSYCHAEIGKIDQYSQTTKIHQIHITEHKVECNHCHNSILHRSIARTGNIKPDCQGCHIDRHLEQYDLFTGQGAKGVESEPAPMFHAGLGCRACHVILPVNWEEHPELAIRTAGAKSCDPCHNKNYFDLYLQAKPVLRSRIEAIHSRIVKDKREYKSAATDSVASVCEFNLSLVERAKPIHNLDYTDMILREATRSLDVIEGKTPRPRSLPDTTSVRCLRCHYGQDEAVVRYDNHNFSHLTHVHISNLGCKTCHEEKPKHGKLKPGPFCMDCHHKNAAVSCEPCHVDQRDLMDAKGIFDHFAPNPMVDAGLTCRDCHQVEGTTVHRPDSSTCAGCHEPGYWKKLTEIRSGIASQMKTLEQDLRSVPKLPGEAHSEAFLSALERDRTDGGHNPDAAQSALDSVWTIIQESKISGK
jgi:nitrate/TMAO reductase-like tetraheme cytochrome c subunit